MKIKALFPNIPLKKTNPSSIFFPQFSSNASIPNFDISSDEKRRIFFLIL